MKNVTVDKDLCIGCGACVSNVPDVFNFNDDGLAEVVVDKVKEDLEEEVMDAASGCPVDAIKIDKE